MKTLIIGGGYMGTVLAPHFEAEIMRSAELDITNPESIKKALDLCQPDFVINTVAFTDTNAAEKPEHKELVYNLNVKGPLNLAANLDIPWVHFSTGMMFDGGPWDENDTPQPTGYYAETKYEADQVLLKQVNLPYILRIHTPLSAVSHPRNFINRLQKFDKAIDVPSSISVAEDVVETMKSLLTQKAPRGIYHTANQGAISAFRIAQLMQEHGLIDSEKNLSPMTRAELDQMTAARGGAHQTFPLLISSKLALLNLELPDAEASVLRTIKNFADSQE